MSDHNLAEVLRRLINVSMVAMTDQDLATGESLSAWEDANEALAAHEAEQQAGGELACERSARQAAQIELERYKALLARSRIDLMRELREQGWRNPGEQQAGEAVAWASIMGGKVMNTTHDKALAEQWKAMGGDVRQLFTHPQQPLSDEQIAVLKFLDGSGLLRGVGYGGLPDGERRPFWWRKQLGDAFPQIRAHGITKDTK